MNLDKSKVEDDKKTLESLVNKDPTDIKIGFHKIKSSITLDDQGAVGGSSEAAEAYTEAIKTHIKTEEDILIEKANQQFPVEFFKEFSLTDSKLMQVSIEEYI
jgi:hemerythrin-like domain-containing protein